MDDDKDFEEDGGFAKLRILSIEALPVDDLSPLAKLQNLEELDCRRIPKTTSLPPLARCYELKNLHCDVDAKDLKELPEKMGHDFGA